MLPVATSATSSDVTTRWFYSSFAGRNNFQDGASRVTTLFFRHLDKQIVVDSRTCDEHDAPIVESTYPLASDSKIVNVDPFRHSSQTTVTYMNRPIEIVPSVLPADFSRLGEECVALEAAGVDRIQWDVMDGNFVPNLTFGPDVIASCREHVDVMFEAHLMVANPDELLHTYVDAGCQMVIVHVETTPHLHRTLGRIRDLGCRPSAALNPSTPLDSVSHVLDMLDMVLVMTVNPGFGGQAYINKMESKVSALRSLISERGFDVDIEVDGGISSSTISGAAAAGANVLVSGSALYNYDEGLDHGVRELRRIATEAQPG
jgi:ribulose-phosphate 3-epimerase|tara:strand:- start:1443 stop:2393 length:951 start_codon:yes stop_codon:yes gene_type:complete